MEPLPRTFHAVSGSAVQRVLQPHPRVLGSPQWCPLYGWLVVPVRVSEVGATCDAILMTSLLGSGFSLHALEWKLSIRFSRHVSFPQMRGEPLGCAWR